jgi:NAD(P)H dehydrogenase (quinone)
VEIMILVTGASGKLGHLVIKELLKSVPATNVVAGVRDLDKAEDLKALGVEARRVDYDDPRTLDAALSGIDKLLLISSSEVGKRTAQHRAVVTAAKQAGVRLLAYTSILNADSTKMMLAMEHKATEEAIRASGIPFVLLRHGWYAENYTDQIAGMLERGVLLGSAGNGRVAPATRADFAAADAAVLTTPGHEGKVYELAGDTGMTLAELAAEVSRAAGKPVAYQDLPPDQYVGVLTSVGVPAPFAEVLADCDLGLSRGELNDSTGDLRRLIGRPTTPFSAAVQAALQR